MTERVTEKFVPRTPINWIRAIDDMGKRVSCRRYVTQKRRVRFDA